MYVGTRRGDFWILRASRTKEVLSRTELGAPMSATAVAANRTVYISTANRLIAVQAENR